MLQVQSQVTSLIADRHAGRGKCRVIDMDGERRPSQRDAQTASPKNSG